MGRYIRNIQKNIHYRIDGRFSMCMILSAGISEIFHKKMLEQKKF